MGAYLFRAVQYGATRLELSAIKPENSRKIAPVNFIFFGTNHGTHRPEKNFQESLDAILRFAVKRGVPPMMCAHPYTQRIVGNSQKLRGHESEKTN